MSGLDEAVPVTAAPAAARVEQEAVADEVTATSTTDSATVYPPSTASTRPPPLPIRPLSEAFTAQAHLLPPSPSLPPSAPAKIHGVSLVSFDHLLGPTVEWSYPPTLRQSEELKERLPFLALPDGAHAREEDYSYFHLYLPELFPSTSTTTTAPDSKERVTSPLATTSSSSENESEDAESKEPSTEKQLQGGTVFGISCNRQIMAKDLLVKGKEVTRSTVQKAVVVLASKPIFGPLRSKLGVVTRAFFAQADFTDKSILVDLYRSLQQQGHQYSREGSVDLGTSLEGSPDVGASASAEQEEGEAQQEDDDVNATPKKRAAPRPRPTGNAGSGLPLEERGEEAGGMYMGTSLREFVHKFRFRTLMLLKLLILQRRVMFYSSKEPVESLCTYQYSLIALIPALLENLEDAADPRLDSRAGRVTKPTSLRTSERGSLLRYLGLPLNVFGKGAFFQPYLPLQQIDLLSSTSSYLVGTTNSIFRQQKDCKIEVIVNIETASLEVLDNPALANLLVLTAADRKWMDFLVTTVDNSWNAADPSRPAGMEFVGSDDFLRAKFEEYVCSMLSCIKFADFIKKGKKSGVLMGNDADGNMLANFNESFVNAFKNTPAFELWDKTTDAVIFDLVEPRHPMEGKTNPIEDVGIRLVQGLHDLGLEENLAPTREAISRGLVSGTDSFWKTYSFVRSDLLKRQEKFATRERKEKEPLPEPPVAAAAAASAEVAKEEPPAAPNAGTVTPTSGAPVLSTTVLAGVDVAKTGAVSLATGIGSFLSSKKSQLFSAAPATPAPAVVVPTEKVVAESPSSVSPGATSPALGPPPPPPPKESPTALGGIGNPLSAAGATIGSLFARPVSTSSVNSSSSLSAAPSPPPSAGVGGFFGSFRRSFSTAATSPAAADASPTTKRTSSGDSAFVQVSVPPRPFARMAEGSGDLYTADHHPEIDPELAPFVRNLDEVYKARDAESIRTSSFRDSDVPSLVGDAGSSPRMGSTSRASTVPSVVEVSPMSDSEKAFSDNDDEDEEEEGFMRFRSPTNSNKKAAALYPPPASKAVADDSVSIDEPPVDSVVSTPSVVGQEKELVAPEPVVEPEPVAEPEAPIVEPEAHIVEPEPVIEPAPIVEAAPILESVPAPAEEEAVPEPPAVDEVEEASYPIDESAVPEDEEDEELADVKLADDEPVVDESEVPVDAEEAEETFSDYEPEAEPELPAHEPALRAAVPAVDEDIVEDKDEEDDNVPAMLHSIRQPESPITKANEVDAPVDEEDESHSSLLDALDELASDGEKEHDKKAVE